MGYFKNYQNDDYYNRLKQIYGKSFDIFKTELRNIIRKRISLCKKELQIRDKEKYKILTSNELSDQLKEHYEILNGYIDENNNQVFGLISQIGTIEHELKMKEDNLYNLLIKTVQAKHNNINNAMIDKLFNDLILKLIRGNDNIDAYINKLTESLNIEAPTKVKQLSTSIRNEKANTVNILRVLQTSDFPRQIKEYRKQYQEYKELLKSKEHEEGYIANAEEEKNMQLKQNSLLKELQELYTKLYGAKYNPLKKLIAKEQLKIRAKNKEKLTDAQQQLLEHLDDPEVTRQYMQSFNMDKFMTLLSTQNNLQNAGLYGILESYRRKISKYSKEEQNILNEITSLKNKIKEYEQNNNAGIEDTSEEFNIEDARKKLNKYEADEKTVSELLKAEKAKYDNLLNQQIRPIRKRIELLETTSANLIANVGVYDDNEGIKNLNSDKLNDQEAYTVSLYTTLMDIHSHNDSASQIQSEVKEREQQSTNQQVINSVLEQTNKQKTKKYEKQRVIDENDENMNDELSLRNNEGDYQNSFMKFDNPEQDQNTNINYDEMMKLYWENPEKLGNLLFDIDESDAKKWMDKYIENPASIKNPAYRPSKNTVEDYKLQY